MRKRTVTVKEHTRNGKIVEEHQRVIDSKAESLKQKIRREAEEKAQRNALFGEEQT